MPGMWESGYSAPPLLEFNKLGACLLISIAVSVLIHCCVQINFRHLCPNTAFMNRPESPLPFTLSSHWHLCKVSAKCYHFAQTKMTTQGIGQWRIRPLVSRFAILVNLKLIQKEKRECSPSDNIVFLILMTFLVRLQEGLQFFTIVIWQYSQPLPP